MHKNKMKKYNSFLMVGVMVGILFSVTGVYAVTQYASNTVYYINKNSGLSSNNVQGAIDELATIHKPDDNGCPKGYVCTKNSDIYTINLDSSFESSSSSNLNAGTVKIFLKKDEGVYLDRAYTKMMTATENPITIPTVTGYTFKGYYNDNNELLIDENGYITSNFTNDKFSKTSTINAKWEANNYIITLNTNKPTPLNEGYYTNGTSMVYMKYGAGVYLDDAYTNKMTISDNAVTKPTATGYNFLGYYDGNTQMIDENGKITSDFTNSKYSSDKALTAKWQRNFACDDSTTIGSTISYSGKNWTVVTKNEWSCQLVLNEQSSSTGSYNDASSNLTSEYLSSSGISGNKTLYNEMQAGLLFVVNGSYYADTNGGKTNINGLYWYGSGNVWDSTARTRYEISGEYPIYSGSYQSTNALFTGYDGNRTKSAKTVATSTINAGTRNVSNTSSNYTLNNGKATSSVVTGSTDNKFSRSYNFFSAEPKSTNSFVLLKTDAGLTSGSYTNTNWRVRFYPCGGDSSYSNKLAWRYTAKSSTAVTFENVITGTSYSDGANRYLIMASSSTSTTESKDKGTLRTYQNYSSSHCTTFNTYTLSNVNYPIHYRLHIDVKRYS